MRKLTPNQTKKIETYLAFHRQRAEADAKLEALKGDIQALVESRGGTITHDGAKFSVETSRRYRYSDAVGELSTQLRALQVQERETGVADAVESERLVCRDSQ